MVVFSFFVKRTFYKFSSLLKLPHVIIIKIRNKQTVMFWKILVSKCRSHRVATLPEKTWNLRNFEKDLEKLEFLTCSQVATLPKKPGIWEILKKTWKNLKFWTKITIKPKILNNFYMLSRKTLIWLEKCTI